VAGSYSNNADVTLYAVWKVNTYSVTYHANGGANVPTAQTKTHGIDLTLSPVIPTRAGYTFIGWSANSEATTAEYSAGGSYTANSDVTFYAVWEEIVEDTTTSTSESTRETTSTSESTRETTSASESTRETTSTSESTRETTSTSESTRETTSTSESATVTTNTTEFTSMSQSSDSTSTTITTEENKGNDKSEKQPLISDTAVVVIVIGSCIGGVLFFVIRKRKLV
jgi:uncharacterized repeat protein (TIGR02543 family)